MINNILKEIDAGNCNSKQIIWVSEEVYKCISIEEIPYSHKKEVVFMGYIFYIRNINYLHNLLLIRTKCDTIDEQINTCTRHCPDEGIECCIKWKERWIMYDEALKDVHADFAEIISV